MGRRNKEFDIESVEQEQYEEIEVQVIDSIEVYIHKKRVRVIGITTILVFMLLTGRLFYIQAMKYNDYSRRAVNQRMVTIPVAMNRGQIYDKNMIPFTDRDIKKVVIAYPGYIFNKPAAIETIAKACSLNMEDVTRRFNSGADIVEFVSGDSQNPYMDLIDSGRLKGVISVKKKLRYSEGNIAKHVTGYVGRNDKKGQIGIEKSMNSFLGGGNYDSIAAVVDSSKNIIPGLGFRRVEASKDGESYSVKLTLDYHIQAIVEEVMRKNRINGAIVVSDIRNGDVIAMASQPDYDQSDLSRHMNKTGDELINKSIWQYDFGSIFKTVVAAAAFEHGILDGNERYKCEGFIEVGNSKINCSTHKSHEDVEMDLKEAFAYSCNTTFIKIGMEVGAAKILDMASRLGFGQKQCYMLLEEKAGYIPTALEDGIGNISIGQGKIQVTPLQATVMMSTIANDGIKYTANLVDSLVDKRGIAIKKLDRSTPEVVMTPTTARRLKLLLQEVTALHGTGKHANMDDMGGSSGKTSTAETGINNGTVVHGWFSGFFPSKDPKYAMTVFIYNGQSGGRMAAPVFKEAAVEILRKTSNGRR